MLPASFTPKALEGVAWHVNATTSDNSPSEQHQSYLQTTSAFQQITGNTRLTLKETVTTLRSVVGSQKKWKTKKILETLLLSGKSGDNTFLTHLYAKDDKNRPFRAYTSFFVADSMVDEARVWTMDIVQAGVVTLYLPTSSKYKPFRCCRSSFKS